MLPDWLAVMLMEDFFFVVPHFLEEKVLEGPTHFSLSNDEKNKISSIILDSIRFVAIKWRKGVLEVWQKLCTLWGKGLKGLHFSKLNTPISAQFIRKLWAYIPVTVLETTKDFSLSRGQVAERSTCPNVSYLSTIFAPVKVIMASRY